jgi:aerobic-type carbon monoxide dehydrogenase small subunit (CoxS/CutS family)
MAIVLAINGAKRTVNVDPDTPLLWVLHDYWARLATRIRLQHWSLRACPAGKVIGLT